MENFNHGRLIGRLQLNLLPDNRVQTRNINEINVINPRPLEVPEDILNQQRRRNNPSAAERAQPPPIFRHTVLLRVPAGLAITRGNAILSYLMRIARFYYQRDINNPVSFADAQPNLPEGIYTSFNIVGEEQNGRNIMIPFGLYRTIANLREAFAVNYANQNMLMGPEDAEANVRYDSPVERLFVEITMVHPSARFRYPLRGIRARGANYITLREEGPELQKYIEIDGYELEQCELVTPLSYRYQPSELSPQVSSAKENVIKNRKKRVGITANGTQPNCEKGGISAKGHELVTHPNGVVLIHREDMIQDLFTKKCHSIRDVPVVEEDSCILMAFISSQCLQYDFEYDVFQNQWNLENVESFGVTTLQQQSRQENSVLYLSESAQQEVRNHAGDHTRYFFLDSERNQSGTRNWWIRLFNTYNPKDVELTHHEKFMWTLTAKLFQNYIENTLLANFQEEIMIKNLTRMEFLERYDFTDIHQMCQILCDLFDLCISIYDLTGGANRFYAFSPKNQTPLEYLNQYRDEKKHSIKMVNMLYDKGHMHAITDIHGFHSKDKFTTYRKYQYCPFCECTGGSSFRNKSALSTHMVKEQCLKKPLAIKQSQVFDDLMKNQSSVPIIYKFVTKSCCKEWCCYRCYTPVASSNALLHHQCKAEIRSKEKEIIKKSKIFSYDFEAAQIDMRDLGFPNQYYHVSNCVCMIPAYYEDEELSLHPDVHGRHFHSETEFLDYIFDSRREDIYKDALFFAHNGGSYDVTFIIRYLENNRRSHTWLPRPGSHHKFISVKDSETGITFLDFRMFMSGSLSSIGESMKLSIEKGIFPHSFNNGKNTFYKGCVPPIDTEDDWWNLKWAKNQSYIEDIQLFYAELCEKYCTCHETPHSCDKPLWDLQQQMIYYCMLDVKLLAQCIVRFRSKVMELVSSNCVWEHWKPVMVDPYWFVTTPQLCQAVLLLGFEKKHHLSGLRAGDYCDIVSVEKKKRIGQTIESLCWLNSLPNKKDIYHRGNWHREFYSFTAELFADGYDAVTKTAYVCLDCDVYACRRCYENTDKWHSPHFLYTDKTYCEVYEQVRQDVIERWQKAWGSRENGEPELNDVIIRAQCVLKEQIGVINEYQKNAYEIGYNGIDGMKGGRTEVFKVIYEKSEDPKETINYDDVCSLYPYVCAFKEMPLGMPQYILGEDINPDRLFHQDPNFKYWGFIHCKVLPNQHDLLGLLPNRRTGTNEADKSERLMFTLEEQVGTWLTDEVEFAMHHGYKVLEVYNIFHWDISKRSDSKFRPYVDCFIKLKQESEKWSKLGASCDNPSLEEKHAVAEKLYRSNGGIGEIDINMVEENPVMRALMKLFLNNMWGKWAQKDSDTMMCTIYGAKQFYEFWDHPMVDKTGCAFREICPGSAVYKAQLGIKDEFQKNAGRTNFFIGGAVTAHARIVLHTRMIKIGPERMIYCDTDSVIYKWHKDLPVLTSQGLGQWEKEKGKPIKRVLAIAPKFYILEYEDENEALAIKSKGVIMTMQNKQTLNKERLLEMIFATLTNKDEQPSTIYLDNFTIRTNTSTSNGLNYYVMCSLYNKKIVRMNITKREIMLSEQTLCHLSNHDTWRLIRDISTVPIGFHNESVSY